MKASPFLALTLLAGPTLHASITEYTDLALFLAQLQQGYYLENFSALTAGDQGASSLPFSGGTPLISLTIDSRNATNTFPGDNLYIADIGNLDKALGTSTSQSDQLRVTSPSLYAIGAEWFLSSLDEDYVAGSVTLTFSDNSTFTVTSTSEASAFRGYISDVPLSGLRVTGPGTDYVTVDNVIVGSPVPEPGTAGLVLIGALVGALRRRRS